jgi:uncharacterized protein (UPF0218 family)
LTGSPKRYVITPALRRKLKKPVGKLYRTNQLKRPPFLRALRTSPFVISVGDRVTETLEALGRTPDVQVVDEVERRVKRLPPEAPYVRLVRASNPAGTITAEAIEALRNALGGEKPVRVLIEGEEDLLAIPAIEAAPTGASLYYGQPGDGVVMVMVDERARSSAKSIIALMTQE